MKRKLVILFMLPALFIASCSTNNNQNEGIITSGDIKVIHETKFDSIYGNLTIEAFMKLGFEFGDSVDVSFSTGDIFKDIPFYDGYYVKVGDPLVVGYPGYPYIDVATNNKGEFWQSLNLDENDTMCITLNTKGKYLVGQETFSMKYYDERNKYSSDEEFSNFRAMSVSTMKENTFYRGASPVDNQHNRASTSDSLISKAGINFVLDLADSKDEAESYMGKEDYNSPYSLGLYQNNNISYLDMGVDFTAAVFQEKLVSGLTELVKHPAPYYIHCTEGKDRTGFVCFFLEALSGAGYDELEADYMETYKNYYGITKESNKSKYDAVVDLRFKDFVNFLTPTHDGSYLGERNPGGKLFTSTSTTYKNAAIDFLINGGMLDSDIDLLLAALEK